MRAPEREWIPSVEDVQDDVRRVQHRLQMGIYVLERRRQIPRVLFGHGSKLFLHRRSSRRRESSVIEARDTIERLMRRAFATGLWRAVTSRLRLCLLPTLFLFSNLSPKRFQQMTTTQSPERKK